MAASHGQTTEPTPLPSALQTAGSLLVIGAFAAAEASAWALSAWPGSAWLWYLDLELFRPFELARAEGSPLRILFGPASLSLAAALAAVTLLARRWHLGSALIANLCFVGTLALVYGWLDGTGSLKAASLGAVIVRPRVDLVLVLLMSAASFAGCVLSHASFARRIGRDRDHGRDIDRDGSRDG